MDTSNLSSDPSALNLQNGVIGMPGVAPDISGGLGTMYSDLTYEVFDPLNWVLDGVVDLPYTLPPGPGLEQAQGVGGMNGIL